MADPTEEKKAKASTQMRFSVQYMAQGTEFAQDIYLMDNTTHLEKGALYSAFLKWFEAPKIGGMSAKGFGIFDAESNLGINVVNGEATAPDDVLELVEKYLAFVKSVGSNALELLESGKIGKK